MIYTDQIKPTGKVRLTKTWRDGRVEVIEHSQNLVVDNGKSALARLLGGSGSGRNVDRFAVGTSGTAAAVTDSAITSPQLFPATAGFAGATSVEFSFEIDYSEANGMTIRELGLICANGALFARKVTSAITKTSDFRLSGTWTISFV